MSGQGERPGTIRAVAHGDMANHITQPAFWITIALGCLLFLIYPLIDLRRSHFTPERLIPALIGMAIFVGIYLWLMLHGPFGIALSAAEARRHVLLLAALVAAVIFLTVVYGVTWAWFVLYANLVAGLKLPARVTAIAIPVFTVLTLGAAIMAHGWDANGPAIPTVVSVSILMIGVSRILGTIRELRAARQEIARLAATEAVTEERLRFARDLHDLLGHSLSTITLKNEVARRLIAGDPDRATQEIDDAIAVAREALQEVREAVSGYRQPTLAIELGSATEILAAAGIACQCEDQHESLPPGVESVLAWVVREGVTNVVRHSNARHCTIRIAQTDGTVTAEVTDDGSARAAEAYRTGNGLRGLAERAARQHGQFEAGPDVAGGFHLRIILPLTDTNTTAVATAERGTTR